MTFLMSRPIIGQHMIFVDRWEWRWNQQGINYSSEQSHIAATLNATAAIPFER